MNIQKYPVLVRLLLVLLVEVAVAAPVIREASFHRVFEEDSNDVPLDE